MQAELTEYCLVQNSAVPVTPAVQRPAQREVQSENGSVGTSSLELFSPQMFRASLFEPLFSAPWTLQLSVESESSFDRLRRGDGREGNVRHEEERDTWVQGNLQLSASCSYSLTLTNPESTTYYRMQCQRMPVGKLQSKSLLSPAAFENSWWAADSGPLTKVFLVERDASLRVGSCLISFNGTFRRFPPC
ncbi:hypothetical protein R1flu_026889 [Riccia fluitans]|uniref:Uncharacterized protein n=1 Tax=Riccia fluitans TaxID=41844 RepID=A0ABD1XHA0_9MARC